MIRETEELSARSLICSVAAVFLAACTPKMPEGYKENLFPTGFESGPRPGNYFYSTWFGRHLYSMQEEALWSAELPEGEALVIRLLVLPTFSYPTVVRLNLREDGEGGFVQKDTFGAGGYEAGRIRNQYAGSIPTQDVARFRKVVRDLGFFDGRIANGFDEDVPLVGPNGEPVWGAATDGTTVVLEFKSREDYFVLQRHEAEVRQSSALGMLISEIAQTGGNTPLTPLDVWRPAP
jgi:hypothetical protein